MGRSLANSQTSVRKIKSILNFKNNYKLLLTKITETRYIFTQWFAAVAELEICRHAVAPT
jgi:hypothetical protein